MKELTAIWHTNGKSDNLWAEAEVGGNWVRISNTFSLEYWITKEQALELAAALIEWGRS